MAGWNLAHNGLAMQVLIVARACALVTSLAARLRAEGHAVALRSHTRALTGQPSIEEHRLIILDIETTPLHLVLDSCHELRRDFSPLLLAFGGCFPAARRAEILEAGADAYVGEPTDLTELLAQIHALLRRRPLNPLDEPEGSPPLTAELRLDLVNQRLVGDRKHIALSNQEFRLLAYLVRHAGIVLTRDALLDAAWGFEHAGSPREVDVYIRYLRRKIEPDPARPRYLLRTTSTGVGASRPLATRPVAPFYSKGFRCSSSSGASFSSLRMGTHVF